MDRHAAIEAILEHVKSTDLVMSTTGMISREVHSIKDRPGNFYMIGSMGLLSSLGLGVALLNPELKTIVLEGDGSALMNLGTLPLIAVEKPSNLIHIILDNQAYESTGSQPTITSEVSLARIGEAAGYPNVVQVDGISRLKECFVTCYNEAGPHLIVARVELSPPSGIPRVEIEPHVLSQRLKNFINGGEGI